MASNEQHSEAADAKPHRRGLAELLCHLRVFPRSRLRLVANIIGLLFITLVLVGLILTQTPLAKRVVLPILEAAAGVEAEATAVRIELNGTLVFDDLVLRVPGIAGPGGRLFSADRVVIVPDYRGVLLQDTRIGYAHIEGAVIRLSVDAETGRPNVTALGSAGAGDERFEPPLLSINASRLEYGEHTAAGAYEVLKALALNGSIQRAGDGYEATVLAASPATGERIRIAATQQDQFLRAVLDEVDLVHWPAAIAPRPIRPLAAALNAEGSASEVRFTYDFTNDEFSIAGVLDDVAMSLPFDRDGNYRLTGERARISELSGVISIDSVDGVTADASGMIETLPYELSIESESLSFEEPFRIGLVTRNFALTEDISLLSFAPDDVLDEFARFDRLEGLIDAAVLIERRRRDDDSISDGEITATLSFRNATASYRSFPYTFRDLRGTVTVTPDLNVRIVGIEGVADTGATISASGVFRSREGTTPDNPLQVELDIEVDDVPVGPDQPAFVTMLGDQAEVVEQLFATDMLIDLTEEQLAVPGIGRFEVGGTGAVDIILRRRFGGRGSWNNRIVVTAPRMGLVPKSFPLPIVAQDLRLTLFPLPDDRIRAVIEDGVAIAAGGGRGVVDLELLLGEGEGGGSARIEPTVSVSVDEIPASEPLEHAISLVGGERSDRREALREFFDRLGPSGLLSGDVWVGRLENGELGVQVFADVRDGALALSSDLGEGARLERVEGVVEVFERAVHVDLVGVAPATDTSIAAIATVELDTDTPFIEVLVDADAADTSLPIAESIAAFSTGAAETVAEILSSRNIRGRADVRTRVTIEPDGPTAVRIVAGEVVEVSFDAFEDVRLTLSRSSGEAAIEIGSELRFRRFEATLAINGTPSGTVRVDGTLPLTEDGLGDGGGVEFALDDAVLESALAQRLLQQRSGLSEAMLRDLALSGEFDASGTLSAAGGELAVVGVMSPRSLSLTLDGTRIEFPRVAGQASIDADGVITLRDVGLESADAWSATLDGTLDTTDRQLDLAIGVASDDGIPGSLRALLPSPAADALAQIGLEASGPIAVEIGTLRADLGEGGAMRVEGSASFERASAEVGIEVSEAAGRVGFEASQDGATVTLALDRATAMGVGATAIVGTIEVDDGAVSFPRIAADMHAGRITAHGELAPSARGRRYEVGVGLSDIHLPSLLADLNDEPIPDDPTESFGRLDAGLTLSGIVGRPESRTGRGEIRIPDGSVITNAFFARLVSVGNLQVPTSGAVSDARASFFIRGDRMSFDRISALVQSVELYGFGLLGIESRELDLYFSSRRLERIPVLTDVFDGIKDELVTVRVTGTLTDRNVFAETLPVTRRILESIFGTEPSGSAALDALRRRANEPRVYNQQQRPLQPVATTPEG